MSCWTLPDFAKHLKRDPAGRGFTHLGKDGVLRTLTGDYEVVDARGLNPEEIKEILDAMPPQMAQMIQKEDFRDVDGTKVTSEEALFHPAPGILPPKPSEEEAAERRKLAKQRQEAYLQAKREQCAELE
ncbi:hypothetical protein IFM58399_05258 [Aspergillus lentulus]|uniref:Uncharacterized protein n=1 Tax=Aspergillus lentulus TaxID=293939 RepID=A0AAN5YK34_ASPLE|nr:uncharacterized protein IFM58399_05258 [Aspergillus lentulus]KAF4202389.1 hypothetical protein CNMCM8927_000260 [Aspergillus lentulus]GFF38508.1 hypothetical protein IFM58399_05258 [Aspergillus lentulus]GFF71670.1 hypothetical protein IFM62136_08142 [Aspergillus lentulus]GFF83374.1 hypothetical protein IFM60648_06674 [Aspergillus lentulus]GFF89191.1 hypothetical protein IFM47457_08067 [Aspergillus lentulus]